MMGSSIKKTGWICFIILLLPVVMFAQPVISSVVLSPPTPSFGQQFTVTVNYCAQKNNAIVLTAAISTSAIFQNAQLSGSGQVFLVTKRGVNVAVPSASPGEDFGLVVRSSWGNGAPSNCSFCNGATPDAAGTTATATFVLTMPNQESFPGCTNTSFQMLFDMYDSNMSEGTWDDAAITCASGSNKYATPAWNIPVMTAFYNIQKSAEGVLQVANDLLLYQINYEYANQALTITDTIPGGGNFTLVQAGPSGIWNGLPAIGQTSGTLTWTLPNKTGIRGTTQGTVWFLLKMTGPIADGTVIPNTANATGSVTGAKTSSISITKGAPVINITKTQRDSVVNTGANITYYLEYSVNGSKLDAYQPFDDLTSGTFTSVTGPPVGWGFDPPTMTNGTWDIYEECPGTGDRIIRGTSAVNNYPGLLYKGLPGSFCQGIIISDVKISASYEGADALVFIRNNGQVGANSFAYAVGLSVDRDFGSMGPQGYLGFQKCYGSPSTCSWPGAPAAADPGIGKIETNRWYTLKVEALSDYSFRAKVWRKGDPEPGGWDITWTDTAAPALGACAAGPWYPGYGQQGGSTGSVNDHYNNFVIYEPRVAASTILYDTIPTNVTYLGYTGLLAPVTTSPLLQWNLGNLTNEGGTYTWWGRVSGCNPITNRASISGTGTPRVATVDSNQVIANVICPVVTGITKTANVTQAGMGTVITWTITYCNNGISDIANYTIRDTMPTGMSYMGCTGGACSQSGGIVTWNLGTVVVGTCNLTVTWWGAVTAIPSNPFGIEEFFALVPDTKTIVSRSMLASR